MGGEMRTSPARHAASGARVEEVRLRLRDLQHREPLTGADVDVARARAEDARGRLEMARWRARQTASAATALHGASPLLDRLDGLDWLDWPGPEPGVRPNPSWLDQRGALEADVPAAWAEEGYLHECCFFSSPQELLDIVGPPLRRAAARGELLVLGGSEQNNAALAGALGPDARVLTLRRPDGWSSAVTTFSRYRDVVRSHARDRAPRIRLVVEPRFDTGPDGWDEWRRFEGLCNQLFAGFAISHMCLYDVRTVPKAVLATAELTHPYVRGEGVRAPNALYVDPDELRRLSGPITSTALGLSPELVFRDVYRLGEVARRLTVLLRDRQMSVRSIEDLLTAMSEVTSLLVTAWASAVTVRVWTPPRGVVCALSPQTPVLVDDPDAPSAADLSESLMRSRLGAQVAKRLCDDLTTVRDAEGFSVRLTKRR